MRDGEYADTLRWRGHASLAEERAGVCDIEATVPGYLPWDTSGVVVRQDGCHVQSAEITARMQPAESD